MNTHGSEIYVLAAKIASHLHFATKVAENLSLTAKNAHAVSARAGQQASGFRAITSYIEDLAASTISQAKRININAIEISRLATTREHLLKAYRYFHQTQHSAADAPFLSSLDTPISRTSKELSDLEGDFKSRLWQLEQLLEETQQQIRAADIISSTSKVEASQAGAFKPQLEVIAENIADSASSIKKHLYQAHRLLLDVTVALQTTGRTS